jgi:FlaA1/EpsC-like NDP-sugar epimerase
MMGLSKYFAELAVHRQAALDTQMHSAIVRFGNVIGSRGSVIPLFQRQLERGGPLTLTDYEMTRYFMTIPEAVQLVLQASVLPLDARTLILDMGEPVRILDLAQNLIRLSGYQPHEIEIQTTGIRAGEKLHETLIWQDERLAPTDCPQILSAQPDMSRLEQHLQVLEQFLSRLNDSAHEVEGWIHQHLVPLFPGVTRVAERIGVRYD